MRGPAPLALALALSVGVGGAAGCYRYATDLPGVLDLRSDGASAPSRVEPEVPSSVRREGLSAVLSGSGVVQDGAELRIEDRHYFGGLTLLAPGLFLLSNESAFEELQRSLGNQGIRDLRIGETRTVRDVGLELGLALVPGLGCAELLLAPQPYTFTASGRRVLLHEPDDGGEEP